MTKTYCDVCGAETEPRPAWGTGTDIALILGMAEIDDLCPDCADAAQRVDWHARIVKIVKFYNPKISRATGGDEG